MAGVPRTWWGFIRTFFPLRSGRGNPNNVLFSKKGTLFVQTDATPPVVWVNQDGAKAWAALAYAV